MTRRALGQRRPVDRIRTRRCVMPVTKATAELQSAMGDRDAGVSQAADPALMPGTMRNGTLASTRDRASSPPRPKTKGSPPLRRSTALCPHGELDQTQRDIGLLGRGLAAALAGIFEQRVGRARSQDGAIDQRVIDHDIAWESA